MSRDRDRDRDDDYDDRRRDEAPKGMDLGFGLGLAGMIIGIVSVVVSFVPCLGWVAIFPGGLALILSGVGIAVGRSKGFAIAGLATAVLAIGIGSWWYYQMSKVSGDLKDFGKEFQKAADEAKRKMDEDMKKNQTKTKP